MKTKTEYIKLLKDQSAYLQDKYKMSDMYIFGSVARGDNNENSDVDIFVKMPGVFYLASEATDYLESVLGCKVDLIRDHKNLTPFFHEQVRQYGVKVF